MHGLLFSFWVLPEGELPLYLLITQHDYVCETHCVAPVSVEPALGTRPHVAVLHVRGPQVHVALFVWNKVSQVTDAAHLSCPLAVATWNWALWKHMSHGSEWQREGRQLEEAQRSHHWKSLGVESADSQIHCPLPPSTRSESATRCRSSAGRCWPSLAAPGSGSGWCGRWVCGWRKSDDTGPGDAACRARRFCCTLTTLQCPSCSEKTAASQLHVSRRSFWANGICELCLDFLRHNIKKGTVYRA